MNDLCGVFVVHKETGWTSFDVVAKMRGICRMKKIGHTGTLDPAATGVLPVCVGKATRVADRIAGERKTYRAGMRLGWESDTQDATGRMVHTDPGNEAAAIGPEKLREAAAAFVGGYDQIPPMYSAKHHGGRRLYELAREGQQVERDPVPVMIESIGIESVSGGEAVLTVTCGKGTYIRTLIADIGRKLGCGAVMTSLCRTRVGRFDIADAMTIAQLGELADAGRLKEALVPIEEIFADLPRAEVDQQHEHMARNGNPLPAASVRGVGSAGEDHIRLYTGDGLFIGLFACDDNAGLWRPEKMF